MNHSRSTVLSVPSGGPFRFELPWKDGLLGRLMVQFLELHHGGGGAARVAARTPFVPPRPRGWRDRDLSALARDGDELSDLVADLEVDQKGVPVLIRQYLKLGAKFLSFNVDRAFGDCVDGLILVDLVTADRRMTGRYFGKAGLAHYLAHHGTPQPAAAI
jgi:hypothetical protein